MKAARILEQRQVQICDTALPQVGDGDVLIRVTAVGLCGSDLATYRGVNPMVSYPRIPGHEIAGEIAETGGGVPPDFVPGSSVTVLPYTACGRCSACRIGRVNCCRYNQTMGVQRDGGAGEYIVVPYDKVIKADGFTDEQLVCIEPLSVGWHGVYRAGVTQPDSVLVFGCGLIGLGAIAAAAFRHAEVTAVDIDDDKLQKAKALGAVHTVNSLKEDLLDSVDQITSGDGPSVVIEAVGLGETFRAAVELAAFAGRVVYIGYPKEKVVYEPKLFVSKELDVKGSRNALGDDFEAVIDMLSTGSVDAATFITHRYRLEQIEEALKFWDANTAQVTRILISI